MTVVATAGHVDHGKSSLVLALTGTDPDRLAEEKRRGLTIDLGFAHTTLPSGAAMSIVDVPGHTRFLGNMLAGVGAVSACIFVVDASEGWKPQSEEHLRILELLGIDTGVVVLTKSDLVDQDGIELARLDVTDHLAGSVLSGAPVIPVSAHTGDGLDELRAELDDLVAAIGPAVDRGRPRLWIDRVFAAKGSGTVVTGTLTGGSFAVDDQIIVEPGGHTARVRSLQTAGENVDRAAPGTRVAMNLAGLDRHSIGRGTAVVAPGRWHTTDHFDASVDILRALDHEVSRRGAFVVHIGSGEYVAAVRVIGPEALAPGASGHMRVHLQAQLPLLPGDRFVLRETGRGETVGGGEVLDIDPRERVSRARPDRSIDRVVRERGWITVDDLERLTGEVAAPTIGRWVTSPATLTAVRDELLSKVADAGPVGIDLAQLDERERAVLDLLADDVVIDTDRVRSVGVVDPFADHPVIEAVRRGGMTPEAVTTIDAGVRRELLRRNHLVERDGVIFHPDAIDAAATAAARLLAESPDGFTVAEFRDATGASRKYAIPLLAELDARAITRRRDDLRIAGPRLPNGETSAGSAED